MFKILFNTDNNKINNNVIKECSKPITDFVDQDITKMVDLTCIETEDKMIYNSERLNSRNIRPIKVKN